MPVERVCGNCMHCIEICCDYGVCEKALDSEHRNRPFLEPIKVVDWVVENLVDMQENECSMFESIYGEEK